jgi:hypothetical protein
MLKYERSYLKRQSLLVDYLASKSRFDLIPLITNPELFLSVTPPSGIQKDEPNTALENGLMEIFHLTDPEPDPMKEANSDTLNVMAYVIDLYAYRKALLEVRMKRIGTKKFKKLINTDYPELNTLLEECNKVIKEKNITNYQSILDTLNIMAIAETVEYRISEFTCVAADQSE